MILLDAIAKPANPHGPTALTIGNFDGVHKGHQLLLRYMRELIGKEGTLTILTFSNHPSDVISKSAPITPIFTKEQKLYFLKYYGADIVYCIPFSLELARVPYREFLNLMHGACPFHHLVLGKNAHLGHQREGSPERVTAFCREKGIETHYIDKLDSDNEQVSSSRIRQFLKIGDTHSAAKLMGHSL